MSDGGEGVLCHSECGVQHLTPVYGGNKPNKNIKHFPVTPCVTHTHSLLLLTGECLLLSLFRSNKSLQKYFAALDQSLQGMELVESYGAKFDRTKHGSLFLSKVTDGTLSTRPSDNLISGPGPLVPILAQ